MIASKFTPGPWVITTREKYGTRQQVRSGRGGIVCDMNEAVYGYDGNAANAALIAAAPDLFAACAELLEAYATQPQGGIPQHVIDRREAARKAAWNALAKASS